jgi:LPXTG-motif cell wall-anchored protein
VVPARENPQWAGVRTTPNEFGSAYDTMSVARTDLTASIPHTATSGRSMQVTGVSKLTYRICDPGPCGVGTLEDPARVLHLEARTGASSPWRTVATTTTATKTGKYSFRITSPGTRDYRVVAEAVAWVPGHDARSYAATDAVTTRTGAGSGPGTSGGDGGLPITGAPAAWIAAAGALLVALGAGMVMTGRRRRRTA